MNKYCKKASHSSQLYSQFHTTAIWFCFCYFLLLYWFFFCGFYYTENLWWLLECVRCTMTVISLGAFFGRWCSPFPGFTVSGATANMLHWCGWEGFSSNPKAHALYFFLHRALKGHIFVCMYGRLFEFIKVSLKPTVKKWGCHIYIYIYLFSFFTMQCADLHTERKEKGPYVVVIILLIQALHFRTVCFWL